VVSDAEREWGTSERSKRAIVAPESPARLGEIVLPLADISDTWFRIAFNLDVVGDAGHSFKLFDR
jgi:hypothetical protein